MSEITEGSKVPRFAARQSSAGGTVSSTDLAGKPTVLFFYPKADTPGCTREACAFRDLQAEFTKLGARVLGVSKDTLGSQEKFRDKYGLTMPLLADPEKALCEAFGVMKEKTLYGKKSIGIERSTFLIDAQGVIRRAWRKVKVDGHAEEVLAALRDLG